MAVMTIEPNSSPDENKLLESAREGDQAAYRDLYQCHHRRIYGLCLRLLGDRELAEDALQDNFVQAWCKLAQFREQAAFGSWLHRIAVNQCLGMQRRRKPWLVFSSTTEPDVDVNRGGPNDSLHDLEKAISQLPRRSRQVLVLHDIEGYTHGEVAEALGIAVGTSKTQLHRARKQLKEWLDDR